MNGRSWSQPASPTPFPSFPVKGFALQAGIWLLFPTLFPFLASSWVPAPPSPPQLHFLGATTSPFLTLRVLSWGLFCDALSFSLCYSELSQNLPVKRDLTGGPSYLHLIP